MGLGVNSAFYSFYFAVCHPTNNTCTTNCLLYLDFSDSLYIEDLADVMKETWETKSSWYNIGVCLLISPDTLDTIEKEHQCVDTCFREMLKTWLRASYPRPTWTKLAEALRSPMVGYESLADELDKLRTV